MDGFFTKKETGIAGSPDGRFYGCFACGLYKDCKSPRIEPYGQFGKKIMVIGTAPRKKDDVTGKLWQGQSGYLLQNLLAEKGIDLYEDCISINAVSCRSWDKSTGQDVVPLGVAVNSCRGRVLNYVEKYKPKVIFVLGSIALQSLLGDRWQKGKFDLNKWRGWIIPDQDLKTLIVPLLGIDYLIRNSKYPEVRVTWLNDLQKGLDNLQNKFTEQKLTPAQVEIIDVEADIQRFLRVLYTKRIFAWDIETTGLKPHNTDEHEILIISFCWDNEKAYVIPFPKEERNIKLLKRVLHSPKSRKIAHNMKFENMWAAVKLDVEVQNWYWDTMQAAHILNNQPGISGLKFQTYVRLGIIDYDSEVSPYLKSEDDKNGNALNTLKEYLKLPENRKKAMLYCGYDSLNTFRLFNLQKIDYAID